MHPRNWFLSTVIVLSAVFVLAACAIQAPAPPAVEEPVAPAAAESEEAMEEEVSDEVVELTWLQWWRPEFGAETFDKMITSFEETHPNIKVKVVDAPWDDMEPKLAAAAAGGDESYDMFGIANHWVSGMVKLGFVEDLDPWLENDPQFTELLIDGAPMRFLGTSRAISFQCMPYHFAYNVDIYEEKGLDPPTNWDDGMCQQ